MVKIVYAGSNNVGGLEDSSVLVEICKNSEIAEMVYAGGNNMDSSEIPG